MAYVITLISPSQDEKSLKAAFAELKLTSHTPNNALSQTPFSKSALDNIRKKYQIDILQRPHTKVRLFLADMDATIIKEETLDELAAHAGLKNKISAITKRAMAGELDFESALKERVSLLKNLPQSALEKTLKNTHFTNGAPELLSRLKAANIHCVLVSGGFTYFTAHTAQALGFDAHYGNTLEIKNEQLTGQVIPPILGQDFKKSCLLQTAHKLNIPLSQTAAIGDGANDLLMLQTAGFGIGYRPKPLLAKSLDNLLLHAPLTALATALEI